MDTTSGPGGRMSVGMVAEWRIARNLFPIYTELVRQSGQCPPPFSSFGSDDRPESLQTVRDWFATVDAGFSPAQFREQIEATVGSNDTAWYTVALHFLGLQRHEYESRNKLAYVLTRYFEICCPPSFRSKNVTCQQVAEVLQPLIGTFPDCVGTASAAADELVRRIESCHNLEELLIASGELDHWEASLGPDYLSPFGLARATHLHYLFHLVCLETVQARTADIVRRFKAIRETGIAVLDCRVAGLGEKVPIEELITTWTQDNGLADIEYRLEEIGPELLGMEKALGNAQRSEPDPRIEAELSSLRTVAERLVTQISTITQRIQRLESIVDLQSEWKPSAETLAASTRFRITPPPPMPSAATMTPIAARGLTRSPSEPQLAAQPQTPRNGNPRS